MHPELPIVSYISAILVILPLVWEWGQDNVVMISFAAPLIVCNIFDGTNAIIWGDKVRVIAPVWCDIGTKILIGGTVALPGSCCLLNMRLAKYSSRNPLNRSRFWRIGEKVIEIICLNYPPFYIGYHYVVQDHRFDIVEDIGCGPVIYPSIPAVFLMWVPPLSFLVGSWIFLLFNLRNVWRIRYSLGKHLQEKSGSTLFASRFLRLMSLGIVLSGWATAVLVFRMWFTMKDGLKPWPGIRKLHHNFGFIGQLTSDAVPAKDLRLIFLTYWIIPITAILLSGHFLYGEDAKQQYIAFGYRMQNRFERLGRFLTCRRQRKTLPHKQPSADSSALTLRNTESKDSREGKSAASSVTPTSSFGRSVETVHPV
ncbi:hypothetical protein AMATHDRAFT_5425 [Amanita thiersii Skay4041]|uniref:Uncharacterized protein n=1 Tax=Amanita thiersii Skay4041 TaxID=703135 RepID=A0A2A9NME4_9AGAR|nr:hypothetical protein AMATHDRAFT_5425 [Amanita thiersii Skay4041]